MACNTIVLAVLPSLDIDGRKAYSTRGQLFDGKVDDHWIVKRSTAPFCDAARTLLADGIKTDTMLVMRHARSVADALRSTVGMAAKLTAVDDRLGKRSSRDGSRGRMWREVLPARRPCAKRTRPLSQ